ncbi:MAG TPA: MASE4 domain-containing protein [Stellaceae bacterium]
MAETAQPQIFLSTRPAGRAQRRIALAVVLILGAAFFVTAPFAVMPLGRTDAFIPAYESVVIVEDAITSALLFAQFAILRTGSLLLLATAYLFTALIVFPHMLAFPGVFAPDGLIGAGVSSAAWLYVFWHVGFPLAVIAYALEPRNDRGKRVPSGRVRYRIFAAALGTALLVVLLTLAATAGATLMPRVMASATQRAASFPYLTGSLWLIALAALVTLWWRRRRTLLDLWLAVVLWSWLCEVALSVMLAPARFSLGFYLGRLYGVVAASIMLVLLLIDITALHAQLARAIARERRERERRLTEMEAMLSHLSRVSDLGHVVTTLIHEVNQPLAAIGNYLSALQRLAALGDGEKVATTIDKTIGQSERARDIVRRLRDFVARREIERRAESLATTIEDAVAVARAASGNVGVEIAISLDPRAPLVVIDRIQIEQVLVNLIRNAAEAMAASPRRRLAINSRVAEEGKVELCIADTGPGLPAALRDTLFQPFVTTKAGGMGVGLSICRFIVEAHGEKLQVADNPGGGTVFRFTLPVAAAAAPSPG